MLQLPIRQILQVDRIGREFALAVYFFQFFCGQLLALLILEGCQGYENMLLCFLMASLLFLLLKWKRAGALLTGILSMMLSLPSGVGDLPEAGEVVFAQVIEKLRYDRDGLVSIPIRLKTGSTPEKYLCRAIYVPWRNSHAVQQGSYIRIRARFRSFRKSVSPFTYDSRMRRRGYRGSCRITTIQILAQQQTVLQGIRTRVSKIVQEAGVYHEGNALIQSVLLGIADAPGAMLEEAFKKLGLSHLLVVSGFHVTFVFGVLYSLIRSIAARCYRLCTILSVERLSALLAFPIAVFYVFFTGISEPALRALLALLVSIVTFFRQLSSGMVHALSFALLVVHLLWPVALCDVGVQFTISALLGMRQAMYERKESVWKSYVRVTLYAGLYTGFVQLWWFGNVSLSGFLANPLLVPLLLFFIAKCGALCICLLLLNAPGAQFLFETVLGVLDRICVSMRYAADFEAGFLETDSSWALLLFALIPCYECIRCAYLWATQIPPASADHSDPANFL